MPRWLRMIKSNLHSMYLSSWPRSTKTPASVVLRPYGGQSLLGLSSPGETVIRFITLLFWRHDPLSLGSF
jgi:hypothetical protein